MPRGIPNKKRQTADATATPKRRGRPPGSKNIAKTAAAPNHPAPAAHKAEKYVSSKVKASAASPKVNFSSDISEYYHNIELIRSNIATLAGIPSASATDVLHEQIELLSKLTRIAFGDPASEECDDEAAPVHISPATPVLQSPALPSFVSPPPFPQS